MIKNLFIAALFFLIAISVTAIYQAAITAPSRPIVVSDKVDDSLIITLPRQPHPDVIKNNILLEFHSRPDEHKPGLEFQEVQRVRPGKSMPVGQPRIISDIPPPQNKFRSAF